VVDVGNQITFMIVLGLLFVAIGVGSKKSMLTELKERVQVVRAAGGKHLDTPDDDWYACVELWTHDHPSASGDDIVEAYGDCCGGSAENSDRCNELAAECKAYYNGELEKELAKFGDEREKAEEQLDSFCRTYCDAVSSRPDWCSRFLSRAAIIGIVVGAVVVVGVVAGLLVYFLVIKKKQAD
jgi:hypothetical protein